MITTQIEPSYVQCLPELRLIYRTHHRELALLQDRVPLDMDDAEYARREQDGSLFLTTVRRNGTIAAYYVANVRPGFHYKSTLTGTMDIAYVIPEERNRGLALPLFRHTERELQRRGVKVWYSGCKTSHPLGMPELHGLLGFVPADTYFLKWIGGAP